MSDINLFLASLDLAQYLTARLKKASIHNIKVVLFLNMWYISSLQKLHIQKNLSIIKSHLKLRVFSRINCLLITQLNGRFWSELFRYHTIPNKILEFRDLEILLLFFKVINSLNDDL
jgi:hypothetical protein